MMALRRKSGGEVVVQDPGVLDRARRSREHLEVLDAEAWAHPVRQRHGVPQTQDIRIVVEHAPPTVAPPPVEVARQGPSWMTAAGFMAVVCVLLAIGVGLWLGGSPPWEKDAAQQQQRHSAPAHHGGSSR